MGALAEGCPLRSAPSAPQLNIHGMPTVRAARPIAAPARGALEALPQPDGRRCAPRHRTQLTTTRMKVVEKVKCFASDPAGRAPSSSEGTVRRARVCVCVWLLAAVSHVHQAIYRVHDAARGAATGSSGSCVATAARCQLVRNTSQLWPATRHTRKTQPGSIQSITTRLHHSEQLSPAGSDRCP